MVPKCNQIVGSIEKLSSFCFLMLGTGHERYKSCDYIRHAYRPHLRLTTCFLLMRTTTTQVSRWVVLLQRAGYVLYRALVLLQCFSSSMCVSPYIFSAYNQRQSINTSLSATSDIMNMHVCYCCISDSAQL